LSPPEEASEAEIGKDPVKKHFVERIAGKPILKGTYMVYLLV
jgi:hypothetical protein